MKESVRNSISKSIINKYSIITSASGAIPIPLIDIGTTTTLQVSMLKDLCTIHEVPFDEQIGRGLIVSLLSNAGKRMGSSMLKGIPVIGSIIGGFSNSLLSGVSTYALGHAFLKYVSVKAPLSGLKDIDTGLFSKFYKEMLRKTSSFSSSNKKPTQSAYDTKLEKFKEKGESKFGSNEEFKKWLSIPSELLNGEKPIDLLLKENNSEAVIDKLITILELEGAGI
jgi:uncharacterized protein (DUF697 family)